MFVNPRMPPYILCNYASYQYNVLGAKCNFAKVEVKAPWEPTITLHLLIMDLGS